MNHKQIKEAWNAQADEHNQWASLGEDEKTEFALQIGAALRKDAERYRWLAARATQQADGIGPIFRIDVRRKNDGTLFSLGAAIDAAMQGGQRGIDKILADPEKHGLDLGEKQ